VGEVQREAIRDHLARCETCAAHAADLQRTWDLLALSEEVGTSPTFVAAVMGRVQTSTSRVVWQAPRWAVAAGLAVCLACGGFAGYIHSGGPRGADASRLALATDVSRELGVEAFGPSPADTVAGAYVQLTGGEPER
jgi:hypothetical protein